MTSPRKKTEYRILAERFLGQAQQIERMQKSSEFQRAYTTEMARITPYIQGAPSDIIDRLFALHHRHASQVGEVIREAMRANVDALHRGNLPDSCPVSLAFRQSTGNKQSSDDVIAKPAQSNKFVDRFKPSRDQLVIMRIIDRSKNLKTQTELEADTKANGHPISRKTISHILHNLQKQKLIHYPQGRNKGPDLTPAGREMVADAASQ